MRDERKLELMTNQSNEEFDPLFDKYWETLSQYTKKLLQNENVAQDLTMTMWLDE